MYVIIFMLSKSMDLSITLAGLKGNPLPANILNLCNESNGTQKLVSYLHDNLHGLSLKNFVIIHQDDW